MKCSRDLLSADGNTTFVFFTHEIERPTRETNNLVRLMLHRTRKSTVTLNSCLCVSYTQSMPIRRYAPVLKLHCREIVRSLECAVKSHAGEWLLI